VVPQPFGACDTQELEHITQIYNKRTQTFRNLAWFDTAYTFFLVNIIFTLFTVKFSCNNSFFQQKPFSTKNTTLNTTCARNE
jgi:hypothetical protein